MWRLFLVICTLCLISTPVFVQTARCTITAEVFIRTRVAPALNAETVDEFPATESRFAIAQTRAADGFIWWQLEDMTWVRGDRVFEGDGCTGLPEGTIVTSESVSPTRQPEMTPETTAMPVNPILYEDRFDAATDASLPEGADFSGILDGAYIFQKAENDGLAQVALSSNQSTGTAPVFRQPYHFSLDIVTIESEANNLCVVLLFDVIQGYASFRRFQICQGGLWTYINTPDEAATYSGRLADVDLQDVTLNLFVTEDVYSLVINQTLVTHVRGNGTIFGTVGFGIVPQTDAPGTLYAEFDNLRVRRLSPEEIAASQIFTVCPPSEARSSTAITIAESCLRGVLDGAWSEQCFCEATDILLEDTRLLPESPLTQLAQDANSCITCTIVEGQIACELANEALTLTVNFTPVEEGGDGLLCVVD